MVYISTLYSQTPSLLKRYDVVVSEIMAKPTPTIELPNVEYIELYNRLPSKCILRGWKIKIGNTLKTLPEFTIDSMGFVVVVASKNYEQVKPLCGNIISLSSLSIADAGQSITLLNEYDEVIHNVSFKMSWHSEEIKREGGWSLEMIDIGKPNAGKANWDSSVDKKGGTPGKTNSITNFIIDDAPPDIEAVTMLDSSVLRVHFNESISLQNPEDISFVKVNQDLKIRNISEVPPDFTSIDLFFANNMQKDKLYAISVQGNVYDCAGNFLINSGERTFGIPSELKPNHLLINEFLTSSFDGSDADYLEIFNNSNEIIDLRDLKIGYGGDILPKKSIVAVSKGMQMMPKSYVVFSKNREITFQHYFCKDEKTIVQCDSLPNFAISEGTIFLSDNSLRIIDKLHYEESMHYSKLLKTNGVALERLSFDRPTQSVDNWFSAAETAGYGTPGYENSHSSNSVFLAKFDISNEVISPNNDGFDDFLEIYCEFYDEGERLTINIFNEDGFIVKHLLNNVFCGKTNYFIWDGTDDNNNLLPPSFYIIQLESWNLASSKVNRKRKVVAIYR